MAIIKRHFTARVRYVNVRGDSVQNYSRINPNLQPSELLPLRQATNMIRTVVDPIPRGYLTVMEELTEA